MEARLATRPYIIESTSAFVRGLTPFRPTADTFMVRVDVEHFFNSGEAIEVA